MMTTSMKQMFIASQQSVKQIVSTQILSTYLPVLPQLLCAIIPFPSVFKQLSNGMEHIRQ